MTDDSPADAPAPQPAAGSGTFSPPPAPDGAEQQADQPDSDEPDASAQRSRWPLVGALVALVALVAVTVVLGVLLSQARGDLDDVRADLADTEDRAEQAESDLDAARSSLDDAETRAEQAESDLDAAEELAVERQTEIDALAARLESVGLTSEDGETDVSRFLSQTDIDEARSYIRDAFATMQTAETPDDITSLLVRWDREFGDLAVTNTTEDQEECKQVLMNNAMTGTLLVALSVVASLEADQVDVDLGGLGVAPVTSEELADGANSLEIVIDDACGPVGG